MNRVVSAWNAFWFRPTPAANLCASRAAFFGLVLAIQLPHDFAAWSRVPAVLRRPVAIFGLPIHFDIAPARTVTIYQTIWKVALALACIGLITRLSIFVCATLGTYLLSIPQSFSQITHEDQAALIAMWILLFSACGHRLSVDAWIRRRSGRPEPEAPSGAYMWPVRLIQVVIVSVFFSAGVAKLRVDPVRWVWSDNLAISAAVQGHANEAALRLPVHGIVGRLMALGALATEVLSPLALIRGWPRRVMVAAMLGLLLAIRLLISPDFSMLAALFVFWLPWERAPAIGQRTSPIPDSLSTT